TLEWPASPCRWSLDGSAAGGDQCEGREEVATQVGPSQLVKGADEAAELKEEQPAEVFASRQGAADSDGEREELPNTARTSLSSFKFDRKGVKPMTPTMCRKLIATLYMVRLESIHEENQELRDFLPDQMLVLYGVKKLANKHIGVPAESRVMRDDLNFYIELIGAVAECVGNDHTLKTTGKALWAFFGDMTQLEAALSPLLLTLRIPSFVLNAALRRLLAKKNPSLFQRLSESFTIMAKQAAPRLRSCKVRAEPFRVPTGGEVSSAHRAAEAEKLNEIYSSWDACADYSYDTFAEMLRYAKPSVTDAVVLRLFKLALDNDSADADEGLDMVRHTCCRGVIAGSIRHCVTMKIEGALREESITLLAYPGDDGESTASETAKPGESLDAGRVEEEAPSFQRMPSAPVLSKQRSSRQVLCKRMSTIHSVLESLGWSMGETDFDEPRSFGQTESPQSNADEYQPDQDKIASRPRPMFQRSVTFRPHPSSSSTFSENCVSW
ncbi:MAG: hypothetical protein SGPRY_004497, partial [Prymnesium sp.]